MVPILSYRHCWQRDENQAHPIGCAFFVAYLGRGQRGFARIPPLILLILVPSAWISLIPARIVKILS